MNIRDVIGHLVGQRIVEITQHEDEGLVIWNQSQVYLHMEDGSTLRFWIDDVKGFDLLNCAVEHNNGS